MEDVMTLVKNLIIPVSGIVISIIVYRQSVIKTILEFFTEGNSEKQKKFRKDVYDLFNSKNSSVSVEDLEMIDKDGTVAQIVSFYETWGILQRKHYLPIKTFKGSAGVTAVRMYYYIEPYIMHRRKQSTVIGSREISNEDYARNFQKLTEKIIKKKYAKIINNVAQKTGVICHE